MSEFCDNAYGEKEFTSKRYKNNVISRAYNENQVPTIDFGRPLTFGKIYILAQDKTDMSGNDYLGLNNTLLNANEAAQDDYGDWIDDISPLPGNLGVGVSASGEIQDAQDVDAFAIALVANQTYTFDLQGLPSGNGTLRDPTLQLRDDTGKFLVASFDDIGSEARITFTPSASGTYFLLAEGFGSLVGTYKISTKLDATSGNDVLTGTPLADRISGLAGNDILNGGTGNDTLLGDAGNDLLSGGAGADVLYGGLGNDTYVLNDRDSIIEAAGEGIDTVKSSFSYTLGANLEHLTFTGAAAINGLGNALNNNLIGNAAANILKGGAGNDLLSGGAGADVLYGGLGNDTYVLNDRDSIIEAAGEGIDTVKSSFSYTLGANLEHLTFTGAAAINGLGNALNNNLIGNAAANILKGGAGNDLLSGGAGADVLYGGLGNDTYVLNDRDSIIEAAGEGIDTVKSSFSYTLGANLEHLTFTGAAAINGLGNALNNNLIGNAAANTLKGGAGNDLLSGGAGADVLDGGAGADVLNGGVGRDILSGGAGADRFVFTFTTDTEVGIAARDVIRDFEVNVAGELINLSGIDAIAGEGNDAFTFLGTAAFNQANVNGGLRYFQQNGNTIIQGSTDDDIDAEFEIELTGLHTLTANDFIL